MLKYKVLQTIIAIITEDKVTELFCIADDFCKFFDAHHDTIPRLRLPLSEALLLGIRLQTHAPSVPPRGLIQPVCGVGA